jgi:hypothetical protein
MHEPKTLINPLASEIDLNYTQEGPKKVNLPRKFAQKTTRIRRTFEMGSHRMGVGMA